MYDRLGSAIGDLAGTAETLSGELGYTVDGVFHVVDPDDPRKFWVRYPNGNWVSAFHYQNVPQKPGQPVLTSTDNLGQPYIKGEDKSRASSFVAPGGAGNAVGYHTHVRNSGMDYITDTWLLKQLHVAPISGTLGVIITAGSYKFNNHIRWFLTETLDLTSYIPAATGTIRWVIVAINPITEVAVVFSGTPYIGDVPADPTLIPDVACYELGYLPICAIWLQSGDTSIPSYRCEDLRFSVGAAPWYLQDLFNVSGEMYDGYVLTADGGYGVWKAPAGGAGAEAFTDLTDVPNTYSGQGGNLVAVKNDETGLEFIAPSGGVATPGWKNVYPAVVPPPLVATLTPTNISGGTTATDETDAFTIVQVTSAGAPCDLIEALPSMSNYTIRVGLVWGANFTNDNLAGLIIRDTGAVTTIRFGNLWDSAAQSNEYMQVTDGAVNFILASPTPAQFAPVRWYQIEDDGTNRIYSISPDGVHWNPIFSHVRTTSVVPTHWGVELYGAGGGQVSLTVVSWEAF